MRASGTALDCACSKMKDSSEFLHGTRVSEHEEAVGIVEAAENQGVAE